MGKQHLGRALKLLVTRLAKAWNTSAIAACVERLALEGGPAGERQVKDHFQLALTQHECLHVRFESPLCGTEDFLRAADGAAAVKEKPLLPGMWSASTSIRSG